MTVQSPDPADPSLPAAPAPRVVTTRGGAVAIREAGSGVPVVLLHGIGSGSASWVHQLAALAPRYRVIAWDAPGYGSSEALPSASPAAEDYAAALLALADALALTRFHLVGHSLGAIMAAAFAAAWPGRVVSLTLADAAAGYGTAPAEQRQAKVEERLTALDRLGAAEMARRRAPALLSAQADAVALAIVRDGMSRVNSHGYAQAARMLGSADIFADAGRITVSTMVMCGTADTITPEANVRRIAAAIVGARYAALPGLGHACYIEDAAAFNAVLCAFLAEHPA